jgi:hypothetical protein
MTLIGGGRAAEESLSNFDISHKFPYLFKLYIKYDQRPT